MKKILMLAFAAALSMGVSACQDTTSPGAVLSGTYTLQTINNVAPPLTLYSNADGSTTQLLGDQIRIERDGTYTDVATYRDVSVSGSPGAPYNDTIYGTWALSGSTLQFYDSRYPNDPYYMTVSGGQLIYYDSSAGTTTVYSK